VINILDYREELPVTAEYILIGCWTAGLLFFAQHPDKDWKKFAGQLRGLKGKKVGLFTTYKLATGSMFKKMGNYIKHNVDTIAVELKSRNGELSGEDQAKLEVFLS
jgi:hypothetical protein